MTQSGVFDSFFNNFIEEGLQTTSFLLWEGGIPYQATVVCASSPIVFMDTPMDRRVNMSFEIACKICTSNQQPILGKKKKNT